MQVVHVTTAHPASDIRIFHKECSSLAAAGYHITLLVAGRGTNKTINGVNIVFIPISFRSRIGRMLKAPKALISQVENFNPEVVHFHDPEFLFAAFYLQKKGYKVIYDVHEDLPKQILTKFWIPKLIRVPVANIVKKVEKRVSRRISGIVTVIPQLTERFLTYNLNTVEIRNYPLNEEFESVNYNDKPSPKHICYIGGISTIRGAVEMVKAIERCDAVLELAGPIESKAFLAKLKEMPGWKKTIYHGVADRQKISDIMKRSVIGLGFLHPAPNHLDAMPTKLFEYMLAGLPVVISNLPASTAIIDRHKCGFAVNPLDVDEICENISILLQNADVAEKMGHNGRNAALKYYSWESEKEKLISFYEAL